MEHYTDKAKALAAWRRGTKAAAKVAPETVKFNMRRHKSGTQKPVLFFINQSARGWWLECFDMAGQHAQVSREWMRSQTEPISHLACVNADAGLLLAHWQNLPPGPVVGVPVQRLIGPKNLPYIGS